MAEDPKVRTCNRCGEEKGVGMLGDSSELLSRAAEYMWEE